MRPSSTRQRPVVRRPRAWLVALVVAGITAWYWHAAWNRLSEDFHGNYSGFLQIGRDWYDNNPLVNEKPQIRATLLLTEGAGYDGQFMYYMAFDPFMRQFDSYRRVVDNPPYRFGRIGFSLLTKLFSGDRWRHYPATMMVLIVLGLAVSTAALGAMGLDSGVGAFAGVLVALIPGFWVSLQTGLPEPIAGAFVLAGFALLARRATTGAAMCFALSLLVRETGLTFVALAVGGEFLAGRRPVAMRLLVIACAPVLFWRVYVAWMQYPIFGFDAIVAQPHTFGMPFGGMIDSWRAIAAHQYFAGSPAMARGAVVYAIVVVAALVMGTALAIRAPTPASLAAVVYGLMAVCLTYDSVWDNVHGTARVTFEVFVALAIATTGWRSFGRGLRVGVASFWGLSAAYVLVLAENAESVRQAARLWAW